MTSNELLQCHAAIIAANWVYNPASTDSPVYVFIQACDLFGVDWRLDLSPRMDRWEDLPRISLRRKASTFLRTADRIHFNWWHADFDNILMRLNDEQYRFTVARLRGDEDNIIKKHLPLKLVNLSPMSTEIPTR